MNDGQENASRPAIQRHDWGAFINRRYFAGYPPVFSIHRIAPEIGIVTRSTSYSLAQPNQPLADLRAGRSEGVAIRVP